MKKIKAVVQKFYTPRQRDDIKKLLGKNLRIARENAGLSQSDVMQRLWGDCKRRNRISEIENGHAEIDLFQFLLFLDLYGQSADYILGRSCEPINDILAAHINNIRLHTKSYLEPIVEQMTACVVGHLTKVDKDEHLMLIDRAKNLSFYLMQHGKELKQDYPVLHQMLLGIEQSVRIIGVNEARRQNQMQAQLDAIAQRHDADDGHMLLSDLGRATQYTLPFPEPETCVIEVSDGIT
ncbi:MAG: helix-turn-helix domain-containing protein [Moraxella sp.]|nr:helix-turn-helix domain-containing protein [Moraxella sp.]